MSPQFAKYEVTGLVAATASNESLYIPEAPRNTTGDRARMLPYKPTVYMCGPVPALEALFEREQGLVIIGIIDSLLASLQAAYCTTLVGGTLLYDCAGFSASRLRLWTQLADTYLCGFNPAEWNTTNSVYGFPPDKARRQPAAPTHSPRCRRCRRCRRRLCTHPPTLSVRSVRQVLEYLLGQCAGCLTCPAGSGDFLLTAVGTVANAFLSETVLQQGNVQQVVAENDKLAGRPPTQPGADLTLLDPPVIPNLVPVPTTPGLRQPAVVTAAATWDEVQLVPSNPGKSRDTSSSPYGLVAAAARRGLGPYPDPEEQSTQYFADLATDIEQKAFALAEYRPEYLGHPSGYANYDAAYCTQRPFDDPLCFPYAVPYVGLNYDARGNPLLSDRLEPLPAGTLNAAGVLPVAVAGTTTAGSGCAIDS